MANSATDDGSMAAVAGGEGPGPGAYRPIASLAALLGAMWGTTLLLWFTFLVVGRVLLDPSEYLDVSAEQINHLGWRASALFVAVLVLLGVSVTAAVLTSLWGWRAATNLRVLGRQGLRWPPAMMAFGWWIPLAWYAIPFLSLREVVKATRWQPRTAPLSWRTIATPEWVGVLWVLYLITAAAAWTWEILDWTGFSLPSPFWFLLAEAVLMVPFAAGFIVLVRDVSRRQDAEAKERGMWPKPKPRKPKNDPATMRQPARN